MWYHPMLSIQRLKQTQKNEAKQKHPDNVDEDRKYRNFHSLLVVIQSGSLALENSVCFS